jgi:hypothetical protein
MDPEMVYFDPDMLFLDLELPNLNPDMLHQNLARLTLDPEFLYSRGQRCKTFYGRNLLLDISLSGPGKHFLPCRMFASKTRGYRRP